MNLHPKTRKNQEVTDKHLEVLERLFKAQLLTPQEYKHKLVILQEGLHRSEVRKIFKSFDADKNKTMDKKEFRVLLYTMGYLVDKKSAEAMFNQIDTDLNKHLSFEEFYNWWRDFSHPVDRHSVEKSVAQKNLP
eukprot:TRINITY_DN15469_c0_g1_i1.p1 TRINITY_DN15469_c0_g1~~TRINITY_DN15469_c0_g1_i1.p1  ORF type:complete len:134 (+),score=24.43 TRINITY_DN15469_c0_g1_i1:76-477(+)